MKKSNKNDAEYQEFLAWKARKARRNRKPAEIVNKYPVSGFEKEEKRQHMYVKGIRILNVEEYKKFLSTIPKKKHKNIFKILMMTGLRYEEMLRLYDHEEWYIEYINIIHLPEEAQLKAERTQLERTITPLPGEFSSLIDNFFSNTRPPTQVAWDMDMKRWSEKAGFSPYGMSVKTTRKTIESWMIVSGINESDVCNRQGHDILTSMHHYRCLAFSDSEKADIRHHLKEWGMLSKV